MIELKNVSKYYYSKGMISSGFSKVSLKFNLGEFVAITGESGSGKSTLLNVISGLDSYEEGEMYIDGKETSHYTEKDYEIYRKKYIGNIFQNFNLVNSYTVYQNIELVLLLNGKKKKDIKDKVLSIIKEVDLFKYKNTLVSKLSGGQKQRVAIARALAQDTPIILADEPTGNLDKRSSESVLKLLHEVSKNKLVIVVTHNYDQIEEYATRKITMHDGKVLEDKEIKKNNKKVTTYESDYNEIKLLSKIRIGIRNAFNIIPKFLIIFCVYAFIVFSMFFTISSFKQAQYYANIDGYNMFFSNSNDKRIVIKKSDGSDFSKEDYDFISNLDNVDYIVKNDTLLDSQISVSSEYVYFYGYVDSISKLDSVDVGRMPENDSEIVVKGSSSDYYLSNNTDQVLDSEFNIENLTNYSLNKEYKVKIVGIKYEKESNTLYNYGYSTFYCSDSVLDDINRNTNKNYTTIKYTFNGTESTSYFENIQGEILPSKKVSKGKVVISEDYSFNCKKYNCKNYSFTVNTENLYYNDTLKLKVSSMYNKKNFNKLTGYKYSDYNGAIFMNENEYNNLFNKGYYQSSVIIKDEKNHSETISSLEDYGIITLYLPDVLQSQSQDLMSALKIAKVVCIGLLVVTLFFISYFIIKLVLKSRNIYYSILRILGSSIKCTKSLLNIELLTISHLSYIIFVIFILLVKNSVINVGYITKLSNYIKIDDYIFLYVILILMTFLIGNRYSRKLFKNTVMNTYREEV